MSHLPERAEKKCLNCGTEPLNDRFCSHCGQENVAPKPSIWYLAVHFFNDFWHFEGSFFRTVKLLLAKPGMLTDEYVTGKRKKYLDPIRLYIFVSAVSLFYLLSVLHYAEFVNIRQHPEFVKSVDSIRSAMSVENYYFEIADLGKYEALIFVVPPELQNGREGYEQVIAKANNEGKINKLEKYLKSQLAEMYDVYDTNPYNFFPAAINNFLHSVSRIFFISLPFFALLLLIFFFRRRTFYPFDHAIFSLHYYCFAFIAGVLLVFISNLFENTPLSNTIDNISLLLGFGVLYIYLFLAMKRFYRQGTVKTFVKSTLLFSINGLAILMIALYFFLVSFLNVR